MLIPEEFNIVPDKDGNVTVADIVKCYDSMVVLAYLLLSERHTSKTSFSRSCINYNDFKSFIEDFAKQGVTSGFNMLVHSKKTPDFDRMDYIRKGQIKLSSKITKTTEKEIEIARAQLFFLKGLNAANIGKDPDLVEERLQKLSTKLSIIDAFAQQVIPTLSYTEMGALLKTIAEKVRKGKFSIDDYDTIRFELQNGDIVDGLRAHLNSKKASGPLPLVPRP